MSIDTSKIGFTRDSEEFRTNTARIAQFARAVDDTNAEHLAGKVASPVFHHLPVMQSMVEVLRSVSPGFGMHGEHDFHFERPIEPGMRLFSVSKLIGMGATKAGATLIIRSDIKTHDGKAVSSQYSTVLLTSEKAGEAKEMFKMMREMSPRKVKVTGGTVDGDDALVDFEGVEGGKPVKGVAECVRIAGKWYMSGTSTRQ